MGFRVIILKRAESDIDEVFTFIVERGAPQTAEKWYRKIKLEISSLKALPDRCAIAPESVQLGIELRQLLFGKRTATYRIIFRILDQAREVHVLTVRHGTRSRLELSDID